MINYIVACKIPSIFCICSMFIAGLFAVMQCSAPGDFGYNKISGRREYDIRFINK